MGGKYNSPVGRGPPRGQGLQGEEGHIWRKHQTALQCRIVIPGGTSSQLEFTKSSFCRPLPSFSEHSSFLILCISLLYISPVSSPVCNSPISPLFRFSVFINRSSDHKLIPYIATNVKRAKCADLKCHFSGAAGWLSW